MDFLGSFSLKDTKMAKLNTKGQKSAVFSEDFISVGFHQAKKKTYERDN